MVFSILTDVWRTLTENNRYLKSSFNYLQLSSLNNYSFINLGLFVDLYLYLFHTTRNIGKNSRNSCFFIYMRHKTYNLQFFISSEDSHNLRLKRSDNKLFRTCMCSTYIFNKCRLYLQLAFAVLCVFDFEQRALQFLTRNSQITVHEYEFVRYF